MLAKKLFLPLTLLITIPCFADGLSKLDARQKTMLENNILMLDIIKATSTGDQLATIEKELPVYESLVELTCMPNLAKDLEYTSFDPETPEGEECAKYIEKLEEILPSDPVLLCAKNGINSSICKDGYEAQYIGTFNPEKEDEMDIKDKLNLEMSESEIEKLEDNIRENLDSLMDQNELNEKINEINDTKKIEEIKKEQEEKRLEIEDQYIKYVNLSCQLTQISIVPDQAPDASTLIKQQDSQKTHSKLEKLILKLTDESKSSKESSDSAQKEKMNHYVDPFSDETEIPPTPTPTPILKFWRIRKITKDCSDAIEKALEFSPNIYTATCKKYGETSPHCIKSIQQFRKNRSKASKPSDVAPKVDGLEFF